MKKLGELLQENGLVTAEQVNKALKKQSQTNDKLGKILVKMGFISEDQLLTFLAKQYNVYTFTENELTISKEVQKRFSYDIIYNYGVIPFKISDKGIYVGFSNLSILNDIDEISFKVGEKIIPVLFPDSMYEKIIGDLKANMYGKKDYTFVSFEKTVGKKLKEGISLEEFVSAVFTFEPDFSKVFMSEGSEPAIRKVGRFYKLNVQPLTRSHILSFIKMLTDETLRKKLISINYLRFHKVINGKNFIVNILKQKGHYSIILSLTTTAIPKFDSLGFKNDVAKYILYPSAGFYLFIAPFGHGKSTIMASVVNYFNTTKTLNILFIKKKSVYQITPDKSFVTQIEAGHDAADTEELFQVIYDIEPDIVFLSDIENLSVLDMALKLVESGRTVYACYEAGSISGAFERLFLYQSELSNNYYANKLANTLKLVVNFRLIPVENIDRKMLVYEYVFNSFKLQKALLESNYRFIDSQLRGTADYMPFERKLADLYKSKTIDLGTAETYALNFDLFRNYAGIKES